MLPVNPKFNKDTSDNTIPTGNLTTKIALLESDTALNISEKLNIIALLLGYKWITDVAIDDQSNWSAVRDTLDMLNLPYKKNYYTYKNERHEWLQVAASKRLLDYIFKHRDTLSVIEAGVLYGYPISHSLGYMELIPKAWKNDKTIAEFYFSGVFSEAYSERESHHFNTIWQAVRDYSPAITKQAEEFYKKNKS